MAAFLNKPSDFTAKSAGGKYCSRLLCLASLENSRIWHDEVAYLKKYWINTSFSVKTII